MCLNRWCQHLIFEVIAESPPSSAPAPPAAPEARCFWSSDGRAPIPIPFSALVAMQQASTPGLTANVAAPAMRQASGDRKVSFAKPHPVGPLPTCPNVSGTTQAFEALLAYQDERIRNEFRNTMKEFKQNSPASNRSFLLSLLQTKKNSRRPS